MVDDDFGDLEEVEVFDVEEMGVFGAVEFEVCEVFCMWMWSY